MGLRLIFLVLAWCMVSHAEFRMWQDRAGNPFEAEYVKLIGDTVWIRDQKKTLHKIGFAGFSENDQLYIQLQNPPEFRLKFKTEKQRIHKPEEHRDKNACPEHLTVTRTDRPSHTCSVDIKRKDGMHYEHSLYLHVYWISVKWFSPEEQKRLERRNTIVLKKHESKPFKLDTVKYGSSWEWDSDPVDFLRKEHIVYTRRNNNDPQNGMDLDGGRYRIQNRTVLELEKYFGILVVVVDERGEILAMDSDKPKLEKIHQKIMKATTGQVLTGVD